jgi:hypothetical protein
MNYRPLIVYSEFNAETRNEFVDITQFKASQYLFARPNIRFLDPAMRVIIFSGFVFWVFGVIAIDNGGGING